MQPRQIKEKTLYRGIIRAAWDITWRRREFWPLGFLAALLMMNGGAFEFITRACYKIASGAPYDGMIGMGQTVASAIAAGDSLNQVSLFIMVLVCLAVVAAIAVLATAAGGGLLRAAQELTLRRKLTARAAFASGMEKIGPLLLTQVVGRLVIFAAFVLAALGAFTAIGNVRGDLVAIILFVIFALAALAVSFLMMMTDAARDDRLHLPHRRGRRAGHGRRGPHIARALHAASRSARRAALARRHPVHRFPL